MLKITERQEAILEFIQESYRERGYPPSLREIGKRFKIASTNGVRYHLQVLERVGLLERMGYTSRGIRLTRPISAGPGGVPLLGQVPAGPLNLAVEDVEREVDLDRSLFGLGRQENLFCLRVQGDSMSGAGILEGDIVIVQRQAEAKPGQIVVARIGEEATVKRFEQKGGKVFLCPENPAYEPIEIAPGSQEAEEFHVLGVVVGLIRTNMD